jgi:hypothetical protein
MFGDLKHGAADLLGGGDIFGECGLEDGQHWGEHGVEGLVEAGLGADAVQRLDKSGAKHIGGAEGEFEDVVFGPAFDPSPHDAAAFGRVGAGAGDVDEGHLRIEFREGGGGGEGEVVGEVGVLCLVHSG